MALLSPPTPTPSINNPRSNSRLGTGTTNTTSTTPSTTTTASVPTTKTPPSAACAARPTISPFSTTEPRSAAKATTTSSTSTTCSTSCTTPIVTSTATSFASCLFQSPSLTVRSHSSSSSSFSSTLTPPCSPSRPTVNPSDFNFPALTSPVTYPTKHDSPFVRHRWSDSYHYHLYTLARAAASDAYPCTTSTPLRLRFGFAPTFGLPSSASCRAVRNDIGGDKTVLRHFSQRRRHPAPVLESKMHQTSSRLLRMTKDDRPFTRDFNDLFSTLIVSLLPLSAHRVRLTKVEHTFLSEDAITNLGSLRFSQSNRMPDPKDQSRIVTTTTTTTFSMTKDMARVICQRFLEARFIQSADGRYQQSFTMKGSVWQLTPKGVTVLDRFCTRNGIRQKQVTELTANPLANLVILEREPNTDRLIHDQGTVDVIFRRFIGIHSRNIKSSPSMADSDSLSDYRDGLTGVKLAAERKLNGRTYRDTCTGKAATDWLMDCCTTVDRRETVEIGTLFVQHGLLDPIARDRTYTAQFPEHEHFQPTKSAIYQLSSRGRDLINGVSTSSSSSSSVPAATFAAVPTCQPSSLSMSQSLRGRSVDKDAGLRPVLIRDSNTQRLEKILNDAALRLLFREKLREFHCEENLSFYLDVDEFIRACRSAIPSTQKPPLPAATMDAIKEIMAQAYGIYNAFLAPGSPCELNIDHQLRNSLATRMAKAVGQDGAMIETLQEVMALFEDAQDTVYKLMASDSVPKFIRSGKYDQIETMI